MADDFGSPVLTGQMEFIGIPGYPVGMSRNGNNGTSAVGGMYQDVSFQDNSYTMSFNIVGAASAVFNPFSISISIFFAGTLVFEKTWEGSSEFQEQITTPPYTLTRPISGRVEVLASIQMSNVPAGGVTIAFGGPNFFNVPEPQHCDCCCCLED